MKILLLFFLLGAGALIGVLVYRNFTLQSEVEGFTSTAPTTYTFRAYDYVAPSVELDGETYPYGTAAFNIYEKDITGLEQSEIDDLVYTDFALKDTKESGQSFTPTANRAYVVKANGTDLLDQWFVPHLGVNLAYLMNETEDAAMLAYSKNELSTTVASSTYREWIVKLNTLDAAEGTGKVTSKEGFLPYCDFTLSGVTYDSLAAHNTMLCLNVTYTAAAALSYCDFVSGYSVEEKTSVNSTLFLIDATLVNTFQCEIKFASGLGTTFNLLKMEITYGSETLLTVWDSQS